MTITRTGLAGSITPLPDPVPDVAGTTAPNRSSGSSDRRRATAVTWALRAASIGGALAAWYVLTERNVNAFVRFSKIPGPGEVLAELQRQMGDGELMGHVTASTRRIGVGFLLAAVVGVAIGVLVGRSKVAGGLLRPVLEVVRPIPAIAWVPLAILLFPTSEQGILFITFLAAFFPVVVSTRHAVEALPPVWEDAARTMGAGRLAVLWRVVLPAALPGVFSGLSVAMGVAWICVVSAEMISGQFGVGYYTWMSYGMINYAGVVVGMLTIGLLGLLTAAFVELVGRRATRWLPKSAARR